MPLRTDPSAGVLPGESVYATVTVPSRVESIRQAAEFIVRTARQMQVPPASDSMFEVAIVEALNNAVKHGTAAQVAEPLIVCELERVGRSLTVRIHDQGQGFVLPATPQADWSPADTAAIPESGYGLPIIRKVFPVVRTLGQPGDFALEMALTF
jgi:anti-sigma regulatory factor (Ser/Thr protein kinase)